MSIRGLIIEIKRYILAAGDFADSRLVRIFAHGPRRAGFYYFALSRAFDREHQAVIRGRLAYRQGLVDIGESSSLLRRNIHRLEKGLIMRPRRKVFAEGFVRETVACYIKASQSAKMSPMELKWAHDVLDEYFSVVGSSKITDMAREMFQRVEGVSKKSQIFDCVEDAAELFSPYLQRDLPASNIDYDALVNLFTRRRSVRWYQDRDVHPSLIAKAANAATFAPSACNRQAYKFLICTDKEKARAIAKCAGGTAGFADNLPSIVVVVGNLGAYAKERDRHLIYIDSSLGTMQLMLALETLGLSTCALNWPEVEWSHRRIQKILDLELHERVIMLLAVGYADPEGAIPFSQKKKDRGIAVELI